MSKIQWTDITINFVRGCTRMSEGCRFCYAERVGLRFSKKGQPYEGLVAPSTFKDGHPRWTGEIMLVEKALLQPAKLKKPHMIFVNSMSDTFHKDIPIPYLQRMFEVMRETPQHTYQVLTKRSERMLKLDSQIEWPDNVWMGVSIEDEQVAYRIDHLHQSSAKVKFLSVEPLIGPIPNIKLNGIDWVIVGGESGTHARIMEESWATEIVDRCKSREIPVFMKQMGTVWAKRQGLKDFKGDNFSQFPTHLQLREYPL